MGNIVELWFDRAVRCYISNVESDGSWRFNKSYEEVDEDDYYYFPRDILYLHRAEINNDIKYKELERARLFAYITDVTDTRRPAFWPILSSWEIADITVSGKYPERASNSIATRDISSSLPTWVKTDYLNAEEMLMVINYGAILGVNACHTWTPRSDAGPYIELELGDTVGLSVTPLYPTESATISKSQPTTFQWLAEATSLNTLSSVETASVLFSWRNAGSSDFVEVTLPACSEYTIPANTFELGEIEWKVAIRANSGVTTSTEWTRVVVADAISKAKALSPLSIVDGAKPVLFRWEHVISNGTSQTAFDLQVSTDLQDWDDLLHEDTENNFATIPANTFGTGPLYWRVRTYNLDGVAGEWSDTVRCIVLSAPQMPPVTVVDSSPQFKIRWDQADQQGYEVMLNETVIAKNWGTASQYQYSDYLSPGSYKISVRIQNIYGMWSDWGMALLDVASYSEPEILLRETVQSHVVYLNWSTDGNYDKYFVYRNNVKIAETAERNYTDQFAAGNATYQIRGIYNASGRCGLSQELQIFVNISNMVIAEISDSKWIKLLQSTSSLRMTNASVFQSVTYNHFIGNALPSADIGEAQTRSMSLDSAWSNNDLSDARAFEKLAGKAVCIKTTTNDCYFAVFDGFHKSANRFWTSYQAQLTPIEWEESM